MVTKNPLTDPNQQFTYDPNTKHIYSPSNNLCLDDLLQWGIENPGYGLAFTACSNTKLSQQFVYVPSPALHIRNPNDPNVDCLDGGGGNHTDGLQHPFYWVCDNGGALGTVANHQWNIAIVCPPGDHTD